MQAWVRCFLFAFLLTAVGFAEPSILVLASAPGDQEFASALQGEVSDLGISVQERAAPNPADLRSRALLLYQVVHSPEYVAGVWLEVSDQRASVFIFDASSRTFRVRRLASSNLLHIEAALIVRALVSALIAGEPMEAETVPVPELREPVVAPREAQPKSSPKSAARGEPKQHEPVGFLEADLLLSAYLASVGPVSGGQVRAGLELNRTWFLSIAGAMYEDVSIFAESFDLGLRRFSTRLGVGLRYDLGPLELRGSAGPLLEFMRRWSNAQSPDVLVPPAATLLVPGAYVELDLSIQLGKSWGLVLGGGVDLSLRELQFAAKLEGGDLSFKVLPARPRLQLGLRFLF